MNSQVNTHSIKDTEMLARYEHAQSVFRGLGSIQIVRNGTVFPIWIGETPVFWYARELMEDGKAGREYRLVNAETASNVLAFDHDLLAGLLGEEAGETLDSKNLPINDIHIALDPLTVRFSALGQSWCYNDASQSLEPINTTPKPWVISPDGKQAVFARDYNLWLRNLDSGEERALTSDGEEFYDYGSSSTVWGRKPFPNLVTQARWSPDGKTLFTVQKDRRQVKSLPIVHYVPQDGSLRPQLSESKTAYPGEPIEEYRLLMIDVGTGRQRSVDYARVPVMQNANGGFFSQNYAWWGCDGQQGYFIDIDRYSRRARVVAFEAKTGVTRIVLEETSETHLAFSANENNAHTMVLLPETDEIIWVSERSGWAHFYLYDLKTGALKNTLTSGEWRVRDSVRFDPKRRELFLTTSGRVIGRNPYYCDLVRVNIDTGELVTVVEGDYEIITNCSTLGTTNQAGHAGLPVALCNGVSATGDYAVVTRSRVDTVPETLLVDRDGQQIMVVETADLTLPEGWVWPEPVRMTAADGETELYGVIYKPANFDPQQSYPVIDSAVIGNPISSYVAKGSFTNSGIYGINYFYEMAWAELGFVVVQMDGRGTAYRSKAYHDTGYGSCDEGNKLEDHLAGVQQLLERYPYMDKGRVGLVSMLNGIGPAMGLLKYPDFYKVGASVQIFDGRLQSAMYLEDRFVGPEGRAPDVRPLEDYAANFKGKLLQCVGLLASGDSPPASTLRLIHALQRANKDVDVVIEPNIEFAITNYQLRRMWDYLVRHLQGNQPPREFALHGTALDRNG